MYREGEGEEGESGLLSLSCYSLYEQELLQSSWFNQRLGFGIAGFQGLTNLAINGKKTLINVLILYSHSTALFYQQSFERERERFTKLNLLDTQE